MEVLVNPSENRNYKLSPKPKSGQYLVQRRLCTVPCQSFSRWKRHSHRSQCHSLQIRVPLGLATNHLPHLKPLMISKARDNHNDSQDPRYDEPNPQFKECKLKSSTTIHYPSIARLAHLASFIPTAPANAAGPLVSHSDLSKHVFPLLVCVHDFRPLIVVRSNKKINKRQLWQGSNLFMKAHSLSPCDISPTTVARGTPGPELSITTASTCC